MKHGVLSIVIVATAMALSGCASTVSVPETATNAPAASTGAEAPADSVQAPTLSEGDAWMDDLGAGVRSEMVVKKVSANSMTIDEWGSSQLTDLAGNFTEGYAWYSSQGQLPLPTKFDPSLDIFDFPLFPGKTWSRRFMWKAGAGNAWGHAITEGKVGGWETVTVPAGTFKVLRVDVTNRGVDYDYDVTYWYSPKVSRFVKAKGTTTGFTAELVSYHPAAGPHSAK